MAKLARLRRPRRLTSQVDHIAFNLRRGLRRSYVSPRLCKSASLFVRDALPFNQQMRNFKRNSSCHEQQWRNFDRIELRRRGALQNENSKAPRRNAPVAKRSGCPRRSRACEASRQRPRRADSVETLRTSKTSAFKPTFDPHLCPKPLFIYGKARDGRAAHTEVLTCHLAGIESSPEGRQSRYTEWVPRTPRRGPYSSNQLGEECPRRNNNRPSLEREAINRLVRCVKEDLERIGHLQLSLKVLQGR